MTPDSLTQTRTARWTGGFFHNRETACREKMIPHMWEILQNKELCHSWENFLIAAGEAEGEHSGPPFHDGDFYKWLEAASRLYGSRDDSYWNILLDSIIELIGRVQRKDGYIFTYDAIMKRNKGRSEALDNDLNFEVYNMGHLMSAGCVHYAQTGKRALLDMGEKAADYLSGQFSTLDSARTAICPSHYMGLAQLYRATSDEKYLDLLEDLMALRDSVPEGTDDNQDRIPLKKHREIVGHAVRANYLYAGLCDLYNERDDKAYREVLESVWTDLTTRKLYITGGCGALYDGVSPYGCDEYDYIQRTHQSYGRPYELPNSNGYNETCGAIGFYLWNYRMAVSLNEGKYGDEMEKALYNSVFSGISIAGDRYFYTNALRCLDHQPQPLKWFRHRAEYLTSFCCPPNVLRTIAETSDMMCTHLNDGLAILLYGEAEIQVNLNNDTSCRLKIHTDYPWSGNIRITVQESPEEAGFPVYLRIPSWAESHTTRVNGTNTAEPVERGFIRIFKTWQPGDEIILDLPMDAVLLESNPMVEESRNHLALKRGPLVYCLESCDLPEGCSIDQCYISPESVFTPRRTEIDGLDVVLLDTELWYTDNGAWNREELYRPYRTMKFRKIKASMIPYFAWDNRREGEMTVWLPSYTG